MTCIMYAARNGHLQVVALLVAHGAEVNAQEKNSYAVRNTSVTFLLIYTFNFIITHNLQK